MATRSPPAAGCRTGGCHGIGCPLAVSKHLTAAFNAPSRPGTYGRAWTAQRLRRCPQSVASSSRGRCRRAAGAAVCASSSTPYRPTRSVKGVSASNLEGCEPGSCRIFEAPGRTDCRSVVAVVVAHASVDQVFKVLTDYKRLPSVLPNLLSCQMLSPPRPGVTRVKQVAGSQASIWRLQAESVLDIEAGTLPLGAKELRFSMVEGDFEQFSGRWLLEPDETSSWLTKISYEVEVQPQQNTPTALIDKLVRSTLAANLLALTRYIERLAQSQASAPGFSADAMGNDSTWSGIWPAQKRRNAAPAQPGSAPMGGRPWTRKAGQKKYLGIASVPLPSLSGRGQEELEGDPASTDWDEGQDMVVEVPPWAALEDMSRGSASGPASAEEPPQDDGDMAKQQEAAGRDGAAASPDGTPRMEHMIELHSRRLDTGDSVRRRILASVHIDAPPGTVWELLTDYAALPGIMPNLQTCEPLPLKSAPNGVVRLRQVALRSLPYMTLRAQAEIDVVEKPFKEIQFRQVQGSLALYQGKWVLQEGRDEEEAPDGTNLKFAMEVGMPQPGPTINGCCWWEPVVERLVFEDLPTNLCALKARAEQVHAARTMEATGRESLRFRAVRPRRIDMMKSFLMLQAELVRVFGQSGSAEMPSRADLRAAKRTDLEEAISAHGGSRKVAQRMGWKLKYKRKPRGYWEDFDNVKAAILEFNAEDSGRAGTMPSVKQLRDQREFGLAKAVEQLGGMAAVGRLLGLQVARGRGGRSKWHTHVAQVAEVTGLSPAGGLMQVASKTYKMPRAQAERVMQRAAHIQRASKVAASVGGGKSAGKDNNRSSRGSPDAVRDRAAVAAASSQQPRFDRMEIDGW